MTFNYLYTKKGIMSIKIILSSKITTKIPIYNIKLQKVTFKLMLLRPWPLTSLTDRLIKSVMEILKGLC